ncbi:Serine protease Do-like HtrB, partial [Bienertia sinuspersici]
IIIRLFDGTLLLGKEDYVDYYHNLLTLKVVCEDLSDGMSVISLGREFYSCCLLNRPGELTVVRPWFGFSAIDLNQLPPHVWEIYNILPSDSYVVVKEVYEESHAYAKGVRPGDIIAACNGIAIHSAKQYSQLLFDRSRIVTSGVDSNMASQSFKAVIQSVEDRATREGVISIEGDDVAVDKKFCQ